MGLHKKSENVKLQQNMKNVFQKPKQQKKKREGRERGEEQEQQRERREQKNKADPYTLPNSRSPASGGDYW